MCKPIFTAMCATAAILWFSPIGAFSGGKSAHHNAHYEECAKACHDCQRLCDMCAAHCAKLVSEGKKEHLTTLRTCQDCSDHCAAAAAIVARSGPFSDLICTACADACKRCGDECAKHQDDMMRRCAEECRRCEKACREMLRHVGSSR